MGKCVGPRLLGATFRAGFAMVGVHALRYTKAECTTMTRPRALRKHSFIKPCSEGRLLSEQARDPPATRFGQVFEVLDVPAAEGGAALDCRASTVTSS